MNTVIAAPEPSEPAIPQATTEYWVKYPTTSTIVMWPMTWPAPQTYGTAADPLAVIWA